ncbi:MAG: Ig-like domain-containing protein [Methylococcales bacterium]|nr:Ig-like domain-containing protein [Methylococcales bacterium]
MNINTNLTLRRSIQMILAGSLCLTGVANAVLLDHGPADPNLTWPSWYRDNNGLALGLCKSASPMCLPTAPDPAGFAGNVGAEMFYNMVEFKSTKTGSDFQYRYLAGLEASYLPLGKPVHGTEVTFARIRITFNFNDPKKNGTYKVIHPFGVEIFENVKATATTNLIGAKAANFFTIDVPLGPVMNFGDAVNGPIGPFIKWDTMPAGGLTGPIAGEKFVGDPAVAHTFTGSPFDTNFIRIEGPVGSNLDGLGNDFLESYYGFVVGQIWTAPIAQNLSIDQAVVTTSGNTNAIDVWATSSVNQKLFLTGNNVPSLELHPSGTVPGKYHGHVEYPTNYALPTAITVSNVTSNPIISKSTGLTDVVSISKATYDTNTGDIILVASSNNEVNNPSLIAEGIPGLTTAQNTLTKGACTTAGLVVDFNEVCLKYNLPVQYEVPEKVSILSSKSGNHAEQLVQVIGKTQQPKSRPSANNLLGSNAFVVNNFGNSALLLGNNTLPANAYIVEQPTNGTVALVAGQWTFTANGNALAGTDRFKYVVQDTITLGVSDAATVDLTINAPPVVVPPPVVTPPVVVPPVVTPTPPVTVTSAAVANPDQFAVSSSSLSTTKLAILGNDTSTSAVNLGSVSIVTAPKNGSVTKNADGTVSYTVAKTNTTITDSFTYTVKNASGLPSNTATVQVSQFPANEVVAFTAQFTTAKSAWTLSGNTTWANLNLAQTKASCWFGSGAAPTQSTLIGTAVVGTNGKFSIASSIAPLVNGVQTTAISCQTSNGGLKTGTTTIK